MPACPSRAAPVSRRAALSAAIAGAAWFLTGGHAPYGQWGAYRKRHLLILTTRADPPSVALGEQVAAVLARALPDSKAQVTRAPHRERIASLIGTKQMDVALMRRDDAAALLQGLPPFDAYGPVPLRRIVGLGNYLLVCRDDFPARHAWLIAGALHKGHDALPTPPSFAAVGPEASVPLHPGAQAYVAGDAPPHPAPEDDHDHPHEHPEGAGHPSIGAGRP